MTETETRLDTTQLFTALDRWIRQRPGLDPRDYGTGPTGSRAYRSETLAISRDGRRAKAALAVARQLSPARPELLQHALKHSYSGRLSWNQAEAKLEYCAGQYWPTEYRKAAAAVLENYVAAWKQAEHELNPKTFTYVDLNDVKAANESIGHHWFSRDTMKFFHTKLESNLIDGRYFVTSERPPTGTRQFTVREAKPDGSVETVGDFGKLDSKAEALTKIRELAKNSIAQ